jgi:hypothetical protein
MVSHVGLGDAADDLAGIRQGLTNVGINRLVATCVTACQSKRAAWRSGHGGNGMLVLRFVVCAKGLCLCLLAQDDGVLYELGSLLAAGDPLSEAVRSSRSSRHRVWHPGLLAAHSSSSRNGNMNTNAAAPAGDDTDPAVGGDDLGCTAALAGGPEQQQEQQQMPGGLLNGRRTRWACR